MPKKGNIPWNKASSPEETIRRKRETNAKWRNSPQAAATILRGRIKFHGYPTPTRDKPDFCECCHAPATDFKKGLALDHNHTTGEFRGWLCTNCNTGIGKLGDNLQGLERAMEYLNGRLAK